MVSASLTRALALAFLVGNVSAFAPTVNFAKVSTTTSTSTTSLFMDGPEDGKKNPKWKKGDWL